MKLISLACALSLLVPLSLAAAGSPPAPLPIFKAPVSCPLNGLDLEGSKNDALPMKLMSETNLPAPCVAITYCSDGPRSCPTSYSSACRAKEGCWAICEDNQILYCPGAEQDPECLVT